MKHNATPALLSALTLAACGGGSDALVAGIDGGGTPAPTAGVVSRGTITGFGSVIVNGVRYDTGNATVTVDGEPAAESDLAAGQVVTVRGTLDEDGVNGSADSVSFEEAVEGPISAIDATAGTLTVLGQTVVVDADTSFDEGITPASPEGLAVGNIVEVAGFLLADGRIQATRIEPRGAGGEFEATGVASDVDTGLRTFRINDLLIDYAGATLDGFPSGGLQDGQLVEAEGTAFVGGELQATVVEFRGNRVAAGDGEQVEVEGFITRFDSASDFDVEFLAVTTTAQTVYVNGSEADLGLNRKLEVEGSVNASGVLVAGTVEFRQAGFIRIESLVEELRADGLTLLGISVAVDVATRFEDKSSMRLERFGLADIGVDDYVELRAWESGDGVVATRLERHDFDGEVALRGFVTATNRPDFEILGVTIQTTAGTAFRDVDETTIADTEFFATADGRLVEARGTLSNGGILAEEVEFED